MVVDVMDNYGKLVHQSLHNYFSALSKIGYINNRKTSQLIALLFIHRFLQEYVDLITEDDYKTVSSVVECLMHNNCLIPYMRYKACTTVAQTVYGTSNTIRDIKASEVMLDGEYSTVQDWYNNTREFNLSTVTGSNITLNKYKGCLIHLGSNNILAYNYKVTQGTSVPSVEVQNAQVTVDNAIYYNGQYYVDNVDDTPCIITVTDTNPYTKKVTVNTYRYHIITNTLSLPQTAAYYETSSTVITEYSLPSNKLASSGNTTVIPFGENYVYAYFYIPSDSVTAKIISGTMESEMTLAKVGEVNISYPVIETVNNVEYPNPRPEVVYSVFTLPEGNRVKDTLTIRFTY